MVSLITLAGLWAQDGGKFTQMLASWYSEQVSTNPIQTTLLVKSPPWV